MDGSASFATIVREPQPPMPQPPPQPQPHPIAANAPSPFKSPINMDESAVALLPSPPRTDATIKEAARQAYRKVPQPSK